MLSDIGGDVESFMEQARTQAESVFVIQEQGDDIVLVVNGEGSDHCAHVPP